MGAMMTQPVRESTTVVIVGGGVSGLTAATLLRRSGVECVVLERQSRGHVEQRQRAGVVEYRGVLMFERWGLGQLLGGFPADNTLEIRVDGETRLLGQDAYSKDAAGRTVPQQLLVRNLIAAFIADGGDLRFDAADVTLHGLDGDRPVVGYSDDQGNAREIECEIVAGCDGDHGVASRSVPADAMATYTFEQGISWLTILAEAPPPRYPLMAVGQRGYAAQYARGPKATRCYLQCDPDDTPADWPAERIWAELRLRLYRPDLPTGPITETEVFPLRSVVREPMSHGRLYLLGDAAHIISPMGAKGMNLALYDAEVFAAAVRDQTSDGDDSGLRAYSDLCLERTWKYQEWSYWMSEMLHDMSGASADPFLARLARARFQRLLDSPAAARSWAEMMTGLG
jgi:p-hydroxybenzoate 3-monooxygenase